MAELLEKRSIQAGLVLVLLLIWGYNMLKIDDISTGEETPDPGEELKMDNTVLNIPERELYEFEGNFRDPFRPELTHLRTVQKAKPQIKPKKKPVVPPKLRLTGIIEGTAMFQNYQNKTVYFAVKGDTVKGALVIDIARDSVVMKYKKKIFTVKF